MADAIDVIVFPATTHLHYELVSAVTNGRLIYLGAPFQVHLAESLTSIFWLHLEGIFGSICDFFFWKYI